MLSFKDIKRKYDVCLYVPSKTDPKRRFVLGTTGKKPLIFIGLNPSTADDKVPDLTIKRVMTYTENNNYDSFIMINLYAQRTPHPSQLDEKMNKNLHGTNMDAIKDLLQPIKQPVIVAAWGGSIKNREYLQICLKDIYELTRQKRAKWLQIGELTRDKHPRHPSRTRLDTPLLEFNIHNYLIRRNLM